MADRQYQCTNSRCRAAGVVLTYGGPRLPQDLPQPRCAECNYEMLCLPVDFTVTPLEVCAPPIPSRIRVGHVNYVVHHSQAWVDRKSSENRCSYAGLSNGSWGAIGVGEDESLHPDIQAETLLHELLHQCLRVSGCDPDEDAQDGVKQVEERAVRSIAGPLLAALRDNPALIAYLLHRREPDASRG